MSGRDSAGRRPDRVASGAASASRRRESSAGKFDTLLRILAHEADRGYNDSAVIGGLDGFLRRWDSELSAALGDKIPRRAYRALSSDERRRWVESILARAGEAVAGPPVPPGEAGGEGPDSRSSNRNRLIRSHLDAAPAHSGTAPKDHPDTGRPKPPPTATPAAPRARNRKAPAGRTPVAPLTLATAAADLPFVNRRTAARLQKVGVETLRDLICMFPFRHIDYSDARRICDLEVGIDATVVASVRSVERRRIGPPPGAAQAVLSDGTGLLTATWFRQAYLADRFRPGTMLALSGRVQAFRDRAQFQNPEYEVLEGQDRDEFVHAGNLLPVYPSTEGLLQRTLRSAAKRALDAGLGLVDEHLPAAIRSRHGLQRLPAAIHDMHLPATAEARSRARLRLAFDELFLNQLAVQKRRADWRRRGQGVQVPGGRSVIEPFLRSLPFRLTGAQRTALDEILDEMSTAVPMGRLLQGEVGSGKTVVALSALLAAAASGFQGALMSPTEVLTEQHFLNATRMIGAAPDLESGIDAVRTAVVPGLNAPVRVGLLIGSMSRRAGNHVRELLAEGAIHIVIGTHALLEEAVEMPKLALAVVDEQHRFGVQQRAGLHGKGLRPHLLAMSATPIPRSLALTLYGDLDLSTLRELPTGRRTVVTKWARSAGQRRQAYATVRREVAAGRQSFVVCPFIEPSEHIDARSATVEYQRLSEGEFRDLRVGLLHGRMSLADKQAVMDRFRGRALDVLVATPVIEVGIDVPNATVMLIESADRFGLTQLHQLRGRVGRGGHEGHCLLLADNPGAEARERLAIVARTPDGFDLAEEDLRIRGPGDYVGRRQSGFADLKVASIADADLLAIARAEAAEVLKTDPDLSAREHAALAGEMNRLAGREPAEIS